jgi:hypothetical protein
MHWTFTRSRARGNLRLVMLAVSDEANDDGLLEPTGMDLIARKALVARATAFRLIERARDELHLLVKPPPVRGRGWANSYCVVMDRDPFELAESLGWPSPPSPHGSDAPSPNGAATAPPPTPGSPTDRPEEGSQPETLSRSRNVPEATRNGLTGETLPGSPSTSRPLGLVVPAPAGPARATVDNLQPAASQHPISEPVSDLLLALDAHGLLPLCGWRDVTSDLVVEVAGLLERAGAEALVAHALGETSRHGERPRSIRAWLPGWRALGAAAPP